MRAALDRAFRPRYALGLAVAAALAAGCTTPAQHSRGPANFPPGAIKGPILPAAESGKSTAKRTDDTNGKPAEFAVIRASNVEATDDGPVVVAQSPGGPATLPPSAGPAVTAPPSGVGAPVGTAAPGPAGPPVMGAAKPLPGVLGNHRRGQANALSTDPHCRDLPTAKGCWLGLDPHESAVERAVEIAKAAEAADAERDALADRVRSLERQLESRERMIRDDESELKLAGQELSLARTELQRLRADVEKLRSRLKQVQADDLETLRAVIEALGKYLDSKP